MTKLFDRRRWTGASAPDPAAGEGGSAETGAEPPLCLEVVRESGDWSGFPPVDGPVAAVGRVLARSSAASGRLPAEVSVALSSDARVRVLNATYRGVDMPTNVLSFPVPETRGASMDNRPPFLGDVVLAAETVSREARERAIPPVHHLQHLVLHGILHLLGFDHESEAGAEEMEALEAELLAELGVANPHREVAQ